MSVPDFAEAFRVPKSTLSKISNGKLAPDWERAEAWADRLCRDPRERQRFLDLAATTYLPEAIRPRFVQVLARLEAVDARFENIESRLDNA